MIQALDPEICHKHPRLSRGQEGDWAFRCSKTVHARLVFSSGLGSRVPIWGNIGVI